MAVTPTGPEEAPVKRHLNEQDAKDFIKAFGELLGVVDRAYQQVELDIQMLGLLKQMLDREKQTFRDMKKLAKLAGIDMEANF